MSTSGMSLVIVNYNTPNETIDCLRSFFKSAERLDLPHEVIVVDNKSTDSSVSILSRVAGITLICSPDNNGYGAALNLGASAARYDTLILSNSDIIFQIYFSQAVSDFFLNKNVKCLGVKLLNEDGTAQRSTFSEPTLTMLIKEYFRPLAKKWIDPIETKTVDGIVGALLIVKSNVYSVVRGFDPYFFMYSEEVDFCRRLRSKGYDIWFTPEIEVIHLGGKSTKGTKRFSFAELHRSRFKYFLKFHSRNRAKILWAATILSFPVDIGKSLIKIILKKETIEGVRSRVLGYCDILFYIKEIQKSSSNVME